MTPMMKQYLDIKQAHPDSLLFYRMGDFYELFFEDAEVAARELDIALTRRGKHDDQDIPMCGVPFHASEGYLEKLITKGHRVAVCEQLENPAEAKKRGAKSVVKRDVVRIITPGTITEESLLEAHSNNYLCALVGEKTAYALAWVDLSTGDLKCENLSFSSLTDLLARLNPKEILISEKNYTNEQLAQALKPWERHIVTQAAIKFSPKASETRLLNAYGVTTLEGLGTFSKQEIASLGALLDYIDLTQKGVMPPLSRPEQIDHSAHMELDPSTRRNLELFYTLSGQKTGTLFAVINQTLTAAGARLLAEHLHAPLAQLEPILKRQNSIRYFYDQAPLRDSLRTILQTCPDFERALMRILMDRARPRDLAAIRDGLQVSSQLRDMLDTQELKAAPKNLQALTQALGIHEQLIAKLTQALSPQLPALLRDGGIIQTGYAPELDKFRTLQSEGKRLVANLQADYVKQTGINSLKIKHNNVLGYFVDVTPTHADKLQEPFIHRQTLANSVRFTTTQLAELESELNKSGDMAHATELRLIEELLSAIKTRAADIKLATKAIAGLDVYLSHAHLAHTQSYARPKMDESLAFNVKDGRHPVVEQVLKSSRADYTPNDCALDGKDQRLWLITGPNMAGKSTFLRQNALIAILAHMGGYVPAKSAHIGLIDRIYSRVGAADDLARGQSTFMVEMIETATILNQSRKRAFVILDEIGRGTATYDGLSIAWAAVEHLHNSNKCRSLFATHYHELTCLEKSLKGLSCHTVSVKEWNDEVIFLHKVIDGTADRSYGIHVAKIAGLPETVIKRARTILGKLESSSTVAVSIDPIHSLPLFEHSQAETPQEIVQPQAISPLAEKLGKITPDDLTPRQALDALFELKNLLEK